jgi:uncharacterized damage-inducible protein DinB
MEQFIETWHIHHRIHIYLLHAIDPAHLGTTAASKASPPGRGRTVGEQFAHVHNVRLMWLKAAAPELLEGQVKLEKDPAPTKEQLVAELDRSSAAIAALLAQGFATGKIKGFKPHAAAFLGYLISHESHHRGQIMLSLKQAGAPVDKKVQFGLWEWGVR